MLFKNASWRNRYARSRFSVSLRLALFHLSQWKHFYLFLEAVSSKQSKCARAHFRPGPREVTPATPPPPPPYFSTDLYTYFHNIFIYVADCPTTKDLHAKCNCWQYPGIRSMYVSWVVCLAAIERSKIVEQEMWEDEKTCICFVVLWSCKILWGTKNACLLTMLRGDHSLTCSIQYSYNTLIQENKVKFQVYIQKKITCIIRKIA